tara:strand:- start:19760 stop:20074 length:315 start_codon:yes stop_codon:yes gene_type:complete
MNLTEHKVWKTVKVIVLIALPIVLIILPSTYFDEGKSISIFAFFGVEDLVYSTGMTRGIMHLIHLDFQKAIKFNRLSFVVLPLLIILWTKILLNEFNVKILKWF